MLAISLPFDPANPAEAVALLPKACAVFALFGADPGAEPYISRTPNLQRRLQLLLRPVQAQSRRLQLAQKIVRIEYTVTGSDFESLLLLYSASRTAFKERASKRLHLRAPALLRMTMSNPYPRVYVTNKVTKAALAEFFGPFPSRVAAEKFLDEVLNLFLLRRCHEELRPDPTFPGCVYSEMKMCLAPCFKGCTDERYAEEARAVHSFLLTRGGSMEATLAAERAAASEALEFEEAARLHARLAKVQEVMSLAGPAVHALSQLSGILIQPAAEAENVALFLLSRGHFSGPAFYSVAGMRHANEQSGSSSLFAHPATVEAVPLEGTPQLASRDALEQRLKDALKALQNIDESTKYGTAELADHLCLLSRWFRRQQTRRIGEMIFFEESGEVPFRKIQRAISRVYLADKGSASPVDATGEALLNK
ncbi:excinuclease ABC subunit C [Acidipila rosea]|uniref:Excinuclease ABC subunit C n=1 Tax=Acidipila rosea TaxID=768535 RepID=A0A4R1L7Q1_9BACT|nr:excinuclease ABC subunit C [Acidipila rosea]TCK74255.1 hypothetical protein C7378_1877 [Acidipila rosea]